MLVASRFAVRIIDATIQIDNDIFLLLAFLVAMDFGIGFLSYKIYKRTGKKQLGQGKQPQLAHYARLYYRAVLL